MQTNKSSGISRFFDCKTKMQRLGITNSGFNTILIKSVLILGLGLTMLFFGALSAQAQTIYYVRAGATGTGNGSDWNNAYTSLPSTLVRGATYYIADGSYSPYTFDDAVSGSSVITIKKATASNHGTETGWSSAYGDGVATFSANSGTVFTIGAPYLIIDGAYEYGFKIDISGYDGPVTNGIWWSAGFSNITIKNVEIVGPGGASNYNYRFQCNGIKSTKGASSNINIRNCKIHGVDAGIYFLFVTGSTIEYCDIYDIRSNQWVPEDPANRNSSYCAWNVARGYCDLHDDVLYLGAFNNLTVRYNKFHNWRTEGVFISGLAGTSNGLYVYGNIWYNSSKTTGQKALQVRDPSSIQNYLTGFYFYNNSIGRTTSSVVLASTSMTLPVVVRNNLLYDTGSISVISGGTYSHNTTATSDPFISLSTGNLRLAGPTVAGYTLPSPYNKDILGVTRGVDGIWDHGALDFSNSNPPPAGLNAPNRVRIMSP